MTTEVIRRDHVGTAGEFHSARPELTAERTEVHVYELTRPALVIGSTQPLERVDQRACAAQGIEVVRRRSGGGAVLLRPGEVGWIDVVLPRGAPGWAADIHAPMVWLGEHLRALFDRGDGRLTVHRGRLLESAWSRVVCFDGVGAGEVLDGAAKLVGISQRRVRTAARLQCSWYVRHEPETLPGLLQPPRPTPAELRPVALVEAAVSAALPDLLVERLAG